MAFQPQYPWRTRLGWACRGFMYFVDVCEAECLDVARALWLTGADDLTLYVRGAERIESWSFHPVACRTGQNGGYSPR